MTEFGLTGGIGSGKSTVARGLIARGGALVDADAVVKDLQEPGAPVFEAMVEHFGDSIVGLDGSLNRQAVADLVFGDKDQLKALNDIVHPAVRDEMGRRRAEHVEAGRIVVLDIPLLVKPDGEHSGDDWKLLAGIVVVDCDIEMAVRRLVQFRGFSEQDARARVASQATREQRRAVADHIVDNSGSLERLEPQIDACWAWMQAVAVTDDE